MRFNTVLSALALGLAGALPMTAADAEDGGAPIVVELFTSQGCSSCPPADELLHKLAARDDVLALALHVDYWDYIGWKDSFALPGHTKRQKGYAKVAGRRMIYTPQMIINGTDHVVGNHPMDVAEIIAQHEARSRVVAIAVEVVEGKAMMTVRATGTVPGEMRIMLVDYDPSATVEITRGENAGLTVSYANIVQSWQELGRWDGREDYRAELPEVSSAAVFVQSSDLGPILAAHKLP
ncbi:MULTISPECIES: DUF1223 domain-containing protein [unclassified Marinovum]